LLSSSVQEAVLEVDYAGDVGIDDAAIAAVEGKLRDRGGKSTVSRAGGRDLPRKDVYRKGDLLSLVEDHRETSSGDGKVALYVMVLPGRFEVEGVPGVAFQATAFALFPDQIGASLPPGANVSAFQEAVAIHELGHLFGLVNLTGKGGFHEDPEHPGHSKSEDSPMHWAVESVSLVEIFGSGPPTEFSEADRQEMDQIAAARP